MYIGVITKRYAKALLDFALENGAETQVYERVQRFIRVYFATEELRRVLANPLLSREDKLRVLVEAVETPKEKAGAVWTKFAALILQHKRENLMLFIAHNYVTLYREKKHVSQVHLITATPLSGQVAARVKSMVEEHSREASEVLLEETVNPDIMGGFIFQLDDLRLDLSVSHEFEIIKNHFIDKNKRIV